MQTPDQKEKPDVLVVDDDPGARLLVESALEMAGFRVTTAADGASAIAEFRDRPTDCVVLDVIMPGMNGYDVCAAIRAIPAGRHVPILMMTSLDDMESVTRAYTSGANDFSSKGINPMLLAQRVKFLVRAKQTQDRLRDSEARVRYLAYFDTLTGLPNRYRLTQILDQLIAWAAPRDRRIAVLMLDLDGFARINDTVGHRHGDILLQDVAGRLKQVMRQPERMTDTGEDQIDIVDPHDWLARTGGDEFSIVMPRMNSAEAAVAVTSRVQAAFARPFLAAQREVHVSATIGISTYPDDGADAETVVKNADAAMYHAKDAGRGGHMVFAPSISSRAAKHLSLETDLRKAIERREFLLHYQPRVSLADLSVKGVEALLRWRHSERGFVPPDEFIPLAEQSGLIVEIGDWVLREACAQVRRWLDQSVPALPVAVNVSGVQFRDETLVARVDRAMEASNINGSHIEIEMTEGALIEYSNQVSAVLKELKSRGIAIALDDFGTGYSSLSYLRKFPIDILKIDRSFVRDIAPHNRGQAPLVDAIISMAKSLGLTTVAEGVESDLQWHFLRERGAAQAQGFLFCKPLMADDIARWMADWVNGPLRARAGAS
jgi:diguanylate cyclase